MTSLKEKIQHKLGYCIYTPKGERCKHILATADGLDKEFNAILKTFSDELEAIKKEIDQRCTNGLQVAEIYKDAKGTVYKISETVIDEYLQQARKELK